jgi:hypothetical protein
MANFEGMAEERHGILRQGDVLTIHFFNVDNRVHAVKAASLDLRFLILFLNSVDSTGQCNTY